MQAENKKHQMTSFLRSKEGKRKRFQKYAILESQPQNCVLQ